MRRRVVLVSPLRASITSRAAPVGGGASSRGSPGVGVRVGLLALGVAVLALGSFALGRYSVAPGTVVRVLADEVIGRGGSWSPTDSDVIVQIRLPRILGALLVGAALAASGATYQCMFRNPLVSPEILGVSAAAGFGASLAVLVGVPQGVLQLLAFGFGVLAAAVSVLIGRIVGNGSPIVLVLAGVVVGALFNALISCAQFLANPDTTLPEITYWLFGSLGRVSLGGLALPVVIVTVCLAALWVVRWPLTVLATGEDEARTLGVDRRLVWLVVIAASTLMTATAVSVAGIVGWVGLVIPHLARLIVGPSFNRLLPASALLGAGYLLAVDDVARSVTALDIPIGILTALVGAPFFVVLLARAGRQWS